MLNFTVGPVMASEKTCKIGYEQVPYFRTSEFSELMFDNERLIEKFAYAPKDSKTVFITGSGTAAMESVVMNVLSEKDKVLVVDGGSFGHRFVEMCDLHHVPYDRILLEHGKKLTREKLCEFDGRKYSAFIVNIDETSTGVLYDMHLISEFCKKHDLLLICDSISSFLADPFNMEDLRVDVMITGSQKALACPPGVSIIILSRRAIKRVEQHKECCMYLSLKLALKNMERGQTPFTPAVGILRQINARLHEIDDNGGVEAENRRIGNIALDFRKRIKDMPFTIVSESLSNTVTPLHPIHVDAYRIFEILKNEYNIWICPNGGDMKHTIFRVGHIGALTIADNEKLATALKDMQNRGLI